MVPCSDSDMAEMHKNALSRAIRIRDNFIVSLRGFELDEERCRMSSGFSNSAFIAKKWRGSSPMLPGDPL